MAGEEEDYGSARIRIELDDGSAVSDATALGQRIETAIDRATRNVGDKIRRNIERALTAAISVRVEPDTGRFETRLQRALRGLTADVDVAPDTTRFQVRLARALRGLSATVDVAPDTSRFAARLDAALRGLDGATVRVVPDAERFRARVQAAVRALGAVTLQATIDAARFQARVQNAVRGLTVSVELRPDMSRFQVRVNRAVRQMTARVRVEPDMARFAARLRLAMRQLGLVRVQAEADAVRFRARLERALRGLPPLTIRVDPDLTRLNDALRNHRVAPLVVPLDPDRDRFRSALTRMFSGVTGIVASAGRALTGLLQFGAIGIAAAGAAAGVGAFLSALAPAAGIIAALPAAIAGTVAAFAALKLATQGVGDALSAGFSGDAKKFAEALESLSPAARKAVTAVTAFRPQLKALQQSVQESFFKQFAADIGPAIKNLLPLGKGLQGISAEFGKAASEALKFAGSQQALAPMKTILAATKSALSGLSTATAPLLKGFLDVGAAVAKAFGPAVGNSIAQTGAELGTRLSAFAESGRAVEWVRDAVVVFKQLGEIIGNVGGILSAVFRAGEAASAGFLNNVAKVTGQVETFLKSAQGQTALENVFRTIGTVAAQLGPIISALITQLGGIAPSLGPIFEALGPAIVGVINSLGPAIAQLAPAVAQVAQGLAGAFEAVGPALGPLGAAFGQILAAVAPLLPIVGQLVGSLASALAPVLGQIAPLIAPIVAAFRQVLPVVAQLASTVAGALGPVLAALVPAVSQLLGPVVSLATSLGQALMPVISALGPIIASLVPALLQVFLAFNPVMSVIFNLAPLLTPIIGLLGQLVAWFLRLITPVVQLAAPLITFIAQFFAINRAIGVVIGWIGRLVGWFGRIVTSVTTTASGVGSAITRIVGFFSGLLPRVGGLLTSLGARVASLFTRLMGRAGSAVAAGIGRVVSAFTSMMTRAASAVSSGIGRVVSFFGGLISRVRGALSGAGSALTSVGRAMITGFIGGIRSMASSVARAARRVVSGAIDAVKNVLDIGSPSKVFRQIGRDTGRGFVEGLTGSAAEIKRTADKVAKDIIRAFEGRRSTLDDRLVRLVDTGNKRLQKLAAQRDALAKKIADAQKFAAETTKAAIDAFSLSNLAQGAEEVTARTFTAGLENAVARVKAFSADLNRLARRGLRKDLLAQIIGLGPDQGAQIADVLANSTSDNVKRINQLQAQLTKAAGTLGNTSADVLYDAGKNAGRGFLEGLKGQRKAIEKLMLEIAKGMQSAIRTALKIRSPSRVFMKIGDMTGAGLHLGFLRRLAALQDASQSAARAMADGIAAQLGGLGTGLGGEVIPLTRAQRSRQSTEAGAAAALLRGRSGGAGTVINNHWEIREVGNAHVTAQRVLNRLAFEAGVMP